MSQGSVSNPDSKVWFITGCSSGFGKEIALAALKRGDKVIATARNPDKLASLVSAGAHPFALDVTQPLGELEALAEQAVSVYGRVDILVNNAGYILLGSIEEASPEETLAQFNTNVFGLLNVTRAFLPHMRQRKSGVIALIGSIGGWRAVPAGGHYCGTKFTLEGLGEALRAEVGPLGIAVTVIEPGYFRTDIVSETNLVVAKRAIPDYESTTGTAVAHVRTIKGKQPGDPVKGAQRIVDVLTLSGAAEGRTGIPVRLALGKDAYGAIKEKLESSLALLEEWKDLSHGTDHDEVGSA